VRDAMAQEHAQHMQRVLELQGQNMEHCEVYDSRTQVLEVNRLKGIQQSGKDVKGAIQRFQNTRDSCEGGIDEVEKRLREVEEEMRKQYEDIMRQWTEDNEAAEKQIKALEEKAKIATKEMEEHVANDSAATSGQKRAVVDGGSETVAETRRQTHSVLDKAHPSLEAARDNDERIYQATLEAIKALRPEAGRIAAATDAEVAVTTQKVLDDERALEEGSTLLVEDSKARMRADHQQEQRLKHETSEAWARLRKACFQLRLGNLHDFARGIVDGDFDFRPPTESPM